MKSLEERRVKHLISHMDSRGRVQNQAAKATGEDALLPSARWILRESICSRGICDCVVPETSVHDPEDWGRGISGDKRVR